MSYCSQVSCISESLPKCLPNLLKKTKLTAVPLILIPEYGQSNATLKLTSGLISQFYLQSCTGESARDWK